MPLVLNKLCSNLKNSYFDVMSLDKYRYSLKVSLLDENSNERALSYAEENLNVIVTIAYLYHNDKTRVKQFNSLLYSESKKLTSWSIVNYFLEFVYTPQEGSVFNSGQISLDNSRNDQLLLDIRIPKRASFSITELKLVQTIQVSLYVYMLIKIIPVLIISFSMLLSMFMTTSLVVVGVYVWWNKIGNKGKESQGDDYYYRKKERKDSAKKYKKRHGSKSRRYQAVSSSEDDSSSYDRHRRKDRNRSYKQKRSSKRRPDNPHSRRNRYRSFSDGLSESRDSSRSQSKDTRKRNYYNDID